MRAVVARTFLILARFAERRELCERRVEKPADPDALAFALVPDAVHAVVPIARSHQRQTVHARLQATIKRAHAMLVEAARLGRDCGLRVSFILVCFQRRRFDERDHFIEHRAIARHPHIETDDVGQPQQIV